MDVKSRIEASNCLIMNKQSNAECFEESCDKDFVLKNACFIRFSFLPFIENHLLCPNNCTFWRIWSSCIFFQSFIPKL